MRCHQGGWIGPHIANWVSFRGAHKADPASLRRTPHHDTGSRIHTLESWHISSMNLCYTHRSLNTHNLQDFYTWRATTDQMQFINLYRRFASNYLSTTDIPKTISLPAGIWTLDTNINDSRLFEKKSLLRTLLFFIGEHYYSGVVDTLNSKISAPAALHPWSITIASRSRLHIHPGFYIPSETCVFRNSERQLTHHSAISVSCRFRIDLSSRRYRHFFHCSLTFWLRYCFTASYTFVLITGLLTVGLLHVKL